MYSCVIHFHDHSKKTNFRDLCKDWWRIINTNTCIRLYWICIIFFRSTQTKRLSSAQCHFLAVIHSFNKTIVALQLVDLNGDVYTMDTKNRISGIWFSHAIELSFTIICTSCHHLHNAFGFAKRQSMNYLLFNYHFAMTRIVQFRGYDAYSRI